MSRISLADLFQYLARTKNLFHGYGYGLSDDEIRGTVPISAALLFGYNRKMQLIIKGALKANQKFHRIVK